MCKRVWNNLQELKQHRTVKLNISSSVRTSVTAEVWGQSGRFLCLWTQCQEGKVLAVILKKQLFLPVNLGRVTYKGNSKQFEVHHTTVRKITEVENNWKTFKTTANFPRCGCPSKFPPRSHRATLREIKQRSYISAFTGFSLHVKCSRCLCVFLLCSDT